MQNYLIVGQAFLQVFKMFWLIIPLTIIFSLYIKKISEEEER